MSTTRLALIVLLCCYPVAAWSNGGYSDDPVNPDYGTHDWIAQHALDLLPAQERQYIDDNLNWYLYGTELPDNPYPDDGIGDKTLHHVYFYANGSLMDDSSAARAQDVYNTTLTYLKAGDGMNASKHAGIMTHYIVDVAVFGHVMGAATDWGTETHHSDYEGYVQRRTDNYTSAAFDPYIVFDGVLDDVTAYNATIWIANDTTFDTDGGGHGCVWMDTHYNWSDQAFRDECGESLNLAINTVADVLHTLYIEAHTERRGDLNRDGQVTSADAVIALQMAVSGEHSDPADMDGDGRVSSVDALMIMQMAVKDPGAVIGIVINELMPNPIGADRGNETTELYNCGDEPVNIGGWVLENEDGDTYTIPDGKTIAPHGYYLTTKIQLNNSGGQVLLYQDGEEIDSSIEYTHSTERISWQRRTDGLDTDSDGDWVEREETFRVSG